MPLEIYRRGTVFYVRGRIEYDGIPITDYYRQSTGASTEDGARKWCIEEEQRQRRRHLLGEEAALTFADAVMLYPAKPRDAGFLIKIVAEIGHLPVAQITGRMLKDLAPKLYPMTSTDTWWRQVIAPARQVINHAHELGRCAPIRVKAYTEFERIDQDKKRGRQSRQKRKPFTREWVEAFCSNADRYNAALVRFIFETAARIDQAASLKPTDLDLANDRVKLKAQKGHPEQWVTISPQMSEELRNLPPKSPRTGRSGEKHGLRVFGYATKAGYRKAWATICRKAGIEQLRAHSGRHGFYTELTVRQGWDRVSAAKAGRWKNAALPDAIYAHAEANEADIRAAFRTNLVQAEIVDIAKARKTNGK
jgi:integrase